MPRFLSVSRFLLTASSIALSVLALSQVNVTTYHNDIQRSGLNSLETTLTPSNVNPSGFGLLFSLPVDGYVYAQPLYMSNVQIPRKGTHNVVYVATEHNSVYAFDAQSNQGPNAQPLWQVNLGPSLPNGDVGTGDIVPEIGITATPVIVPAQQGAPGSTGTMFVVAKTKTIDPSGNPVYTQTLHALDITTGAEKFNGPVVIQGQVNGIGDGNDGHGHVPFNSLISNNRPALLYLPGQLQQGSAGTIYVGFASHGDNGPYHGWIFSYNATNLKPIALYNTTPNAKTDPSGYPLAAGGIWQGGAGLASDGSGIYFATGNGSLDPANGSYGDAVVRVTSGLVPTDYFSPSDQQSLDDSDADLGSGGVLLLPTSVGSAKAPHLLVQSGKEGTLYLLNTLNLGKYGATDNVVQELSHVMGGIWGQAAYFNNNIYYGPIFSPIVSFPISNATITTNGPSMTTPDSYGYPGPTPSISSNGNSNGIVWAIESDAYGQGGPAYLKAYAASNLANELYNSGATQGRDALGGAVKFAVPTIANGKVYVGSAYSVGVFGIGQWADAPTIVTQSGNYTNSVSVKVTDDTPGADIYYTTDGSTPTQASAHYQGPVTFTTSVTFTAKAFAAGYGPSPQVQAQYQINAVIGNGTGLLGSYFNNSQNPVGTPTATRIDPTVNFNWNGFSPIQGVDGDNWAAEWKGEVQAECSTTYTFYTNSDDGVRVWVNGQQIINDWTYHAPTVDSGTLTLVGGKKYSIVIDYFQGGGGALLQFSWSAPGMPMQIVPTSQLYYP